MTMAVRGGKLCTLGLAMPNEGCDLQGYRESFKGEKRMMPLGMAGIGDVNTIKKITGRDDVRQHLAELGFVVGEEVRVISELGGNLILSVKDSRIALDKTMAMRIMV